MYKLANEEQAIELDQLNKDWPLSDILQLPNDPLIVIVGSYKGKLCQWFAEQYPSHVGIIGYEPARWAWELAVERLKPYPLCSVINVGLGDSEIHFHDRPMYQFGTDACSFLPPTNTDLPDVAGQGDMMDAAMLLPQLLREHGRPIDLLVMNVEGYEYKLLPYLWRTMQDRTARGLPELTKSIAVQFHSQYEPTVSDYAKILFDLDRAYANRFNYFLGSWGYWW